MTTADDKTMIKAITLLLLMVPVAGTLLSAQESKHEIDLGFGSSLGIGGAIPFWLFSNQYSILDNNPFNIYSRIGYKKPFTGQRKIDFSAGFSIVNRYSNQYDLYAEEAYGKIRFYFIDLQAGRIRESFGNHDNLLSSGGFLWSGNALPLPKITLLTPDYVNIPFTRGYLQFKGGISHGWFGDNRFVKNALLHHKYFYAKAGGNLPVNFSAGIHHFAQWGGTSTNPLYGKQPSNLATFRKVFFASEGGSDSPIHDQDNAAGNHLGSYNLGAEIKLAPVDIGLYWQSIFEDNSGRTNRNLWDGLYGISIELNKTRLINNILLEFLSSTYQSGAPEDDFSPSLPAPEWNDNYFNNWLYVAGWSYREMAIGNPLITSPALLSSSNEEGQFINNRIRALHAGFSGKLSFLDYKVLYTFSRNYGTYSRPFESIREQSYFLLDLLSGELIKDTDLGISFGIDRGKLLGNNFGIYLKLVRKIVL